jgi:hypothetical protein
LCVSVACIVCSQKFSAVRAGEQIGDVVAGIANLCGALVPFSMLVPAAVFFAGIGFGRQNFTIVAEPPDAREGSALGLLERGDPVRKGRCVRCRRIGRTSWVEKQRCQAAEDCRSMREIRRMLVHPPSLAAPEWFGPAAFDSLSGPNWSDAFDDEFSFAAGVIVGPDRDIAYAASTLGECRGRRWRDDHAQFTEPGHRISASREGAGMNHEGWVALREAEQDPDGYGDAGELFIESGRQVYGILLRPRGRRYDETIAPSSGVSVCPECCPAAAGRSQYAASRVRPLRCDSIWIPSSIS